MRFRLNQLLAALLMALTVSCGSSKVLAADLDTDVEVLRWEGPIDEAFLTRVEALDFDRDVLISISSPGGSPETGVRVAEILSARNYTVEVTDACLSACANYVFLPATRRRIAPGAFVGFHHDAHNYFNWLASHGKTPNPGVSEQAKRLQALMKQKTEFDWMALSQDTLSRLKPHRIDEVPCTVSQRDPDSRCYDIIARRLMWVPTPSDYEEWGIAVAWSPQPDLPGRVAQFVACRTRMNIAPSVVGSTDVFDKCHIPAVPRTRG